MSKVCQHFLKGNCRFGAKCRDLHPNAGGFGAPPQQQGFQPHAPPPHQGFGGNQDGGGRGGGNTNQTPCRNFAQGNCKFGANCKYSHGAGGVGGFGGAPGNAGTGFAPVGFGNNQPTNGGTGFGFNQQQPPPVVGFGATPPRSFSYQQPTSGFPAPNQQQHPQGFNQQGFNPPMQQPPGGFGQAQQQFGGAPRAGGVDQRTRGGRQGNDFRQQQQFNNAPVQGFGTGFGGAPAGFNQQQPAGFVQQPPMGFNNNAHQQPRGRRNNNLPQAFSNQGQPGGFNAGPVGFNQQPPIQGFPGQTPQPVGFGAQLPVQQTPGFGFQQGTTGFAQHSGGFTQVPGGGGFAGNNFTAPTQTMGFNNQGAFPPLHNTGGAWQQQQQSQRSSQGSNAGTKPCRDWLSSGSCRFGDRCRFRHETMVGDAFVNAEEPMMIEEAPIDYGFGDDHGGLAMEPQQQQMGMDSNATFNAFSHSTGPVAQPVFEDAAKPIEIKPKAKQTATATSSLLSIPKSDAAKEELKKLLGHAEYIETSLTKEQEATAFEADAFDLDNIPENVVLLY